MFGKEQIVTLIKWAVPKANILTIYDPPALHNRVADP
jgi:hypothetical protein